MSSFLVSDFFRWILFVLIVFFICGTVYSQELGFVPEGRDFRFSTPIDCDEDRGCKIIQFVDVSIDGRGNDFACGYRSVGGNRGTSYKIPDLSRVWVDPIDVLSAADGVVLSRRDGIADVPFFGQSKTNRADEKWGNYVVVNHGGGWETVYAHLGKGTVDVAPGEFVKRGQTIGKVGLSGASAYPHLYFSVLRNKRAFDPYSGKFAGEGCSMDFNPVHSMFDRDALSGFLYKQTELLSSGFSDHEVDIILALNGYLERPYLLASNVRLGLWGLVAGVREGDMWKVEVFAPGGDLIIDSKSQVASSSAMRVLGDEIEFSVSNLAPIGHYWGRFSLLRPFDDEGKIIWKNVMQSVKKIEVKR